MNYLNKINFLFLFNLAAIIVLSIGAFYFVGLTALFYGLESTIYAATHNWAMIGLWFIYFTSIVFYPILKRNRDKKIKIVYITCVIISVFFIMFIIGLLSCWEATLLKNLGMDYNKGIRCVQ